MKNIYSKRLSTWKTIIVSDIHTGAEKRFELDENERLVDKIKPNRQKHLPQKYIKIRITKDFNQKHQELNKILDHMINLYNKKDTKSNKRKCFNDNENQKIIDQKTSKKVTDGLYKNLIDEFFSNPEENDFTENDEFIPQNELILQNFE